MLDAVNELRLLLFLECEGGGDCSEPEEDGFHFHQVMLNEAKFKKVSDAIFDNPRTSPGLKDSYLTGIVKLSGDFYNPKEFDGLNSIN